LAKDEPGIIDLFVGDVLPTTVLTILVCALSLTAHWAFMFWWAQHLRNLPDLAGWTAGEKSQLVSVVMSVLMVTSIAGNFVAALVARLIGYRLAITGMFLAYFVAMLGTYWEPRSHTALFWLLPSMGITQGVFALFTMYMPPLFPTLLRTTGAGFCYNIGRIAAAFGTVYFGLFAKVGDYRLSLVYASFLFLPAAAVAWFLPEPPDERSAVEPLE
jgi:MFS family permease